MPKYFLFKLPEPHSFLANKKGLRRGQIKKSSIRIFWMVLGPTSLPLNKLPFWSLIFGYRSLLNFLQFWFFGCPWQPPLLRAPKNPKLHKMWEDPIPKVFIWYFWSRGTYFRGGDLSFVKGRKGGRPIFFREWPKCLSRAYATIHKLVLDQHEKQT